MSTILKSLRKLEEEKALLQKQINLKELMIREDEAPARDRDGKAEARWKQGWIGLLLVLGGLGVSAGAFFLMRPAPAPTPASTEAPAVARTAPQPAAAPVPAPTAGRPRPARAVPNANPGVPLSSIPDFTRRPERPDAGAIVEEDLPDPGPVPVAAPSAESAVQAAAASSGPPEADPSAPAGSNPAPPEEEIVAALGQVPHQERRKIVPRPDVPVIRDIPVSEEIPGLKIKGIIFFGEKDPNNYLFFTLPGSGIHKLKVGERVMEAKLLAIEPGRALFDYEGRTVALRVGN